MSIDRAAFRASQAKEALAQTIFYSVPIYHGTEVRAWSTASHAERETYRDLAEAVLWMAVERAPVGLAPQFATGLRGTGAPIIGSIVPRPDAS